MLRKKYRISAVGILNVIYKRIDNNTTKEEICSVCGIGKDICSNKVIAYSSGSRNITFGSMCIVINHIGVSNSNISKFKYIPWKLN